MKMRNERSFIHLLAIAAVPFALAACAQRDPPGSPAASAHAGPAPAAATGLAENVPKVPFGNQPCLSLSVDEVKALGIGGRTPPKPVPSREQEELPYDNVCDLGGQSIAFETRSSYENQRTTLRSSNHDAPADLPNAFYDVLNNLWFAKNGYYVGIPNNGASAATREKMARMIAAKL